jgi:hypothetical protein
VQAGMAFLRTHTHAHPYSEAGYGSRMPAHTMATHHATPRMADAAFEPYGPSGVAHAGSGTPGVGTTSGKVTSTSDPGDWQCNWHTHKRRHAAHTRANTHPPP